MAARTPTSFCVSSVIHGSSATTARGPNGAIATTFRSSARLRTKGRLLLAVLTLTATGCAGVYTRGERALAEGRYVDARRELEEAVRRAPNRVEAVTALGVVEYKLDALAQAATALRRAIALGDNVRARVYLALVKIREGDDAEARAHLAALHELHAPARLATHAERAARVLGPALSGDLRGFVAASLEDAVECERQRETLRLPTFSFQPAWMFEWSGGRR